MGLISRWLGIDERRKRDEERDAQLHALVAEILRVSAIQAETSARMIATLESVNTLVMVEGEPECRPHWNDEMEADLWEKHHES